MGRRTKMLVVVVAAAAVTFLLAAPAAQAEPAAGITPFGDVVASFDTNSLATISTHPITGLPDSGFVAAIDSDPAGGKLYALVIGPPDPTHDIGRLETLNPQTGVLTPIGSGAPFPTTTLPDFAGYDIEVDPTSSGPRVVRLVDNLDDSFRVNADAGTLIGADPDMTMSSIIEGAAYDRNAPGGAATTLYGLNMNTTKLATIGGLSGNQAPNSGAVADLGALGILPDGNNIGFDISPSGTAFVTVTPQPSPQMKLFTANLGTGALTQVGGIPIDLGDFAVLIPGPPSPQPAAAAAAAAATTTAARKRCKKKKHRSRALAAKKKCKKKKKG